MKKLFALFLILFVASCETIPIKFDAQQIADIIGAIQQMQQPIKPQPAPVAPVPVTPSVPVPVEPSVTPGANTGVTEIIILDLETFPAKMSAAGWHHNNPNAQYYVGICKIYSGWSWPPHEVDSVSSNWYPQQEKIWEFVDSIVKDGANQLKANPGLTATVIGNDAHDRCGSRVGPVIMQRLGQLGVDMSRVQMGSVYNP